MPQFEINSDEIAKNLIDDKNLEVEPEVLKIIGLQLLASALSKGSADGILTTLQTECILQAHKPIEDSELLKGAGGAIRESISEHITKTSSKLFSI